MRIESVVLNASPLITLFRSGQAGLLPRLFPHIVVPNAVWREVVMDEKEDLAARELSLQPWPTRVDVVRSPSGRRARRITTRSWDGNTCGTPLGRGIGPGEKP